MGTQSIFSVCVSSCFVRLGKFSLFVWDPPLLFSLSGTYSYLDVGLFLRNCLLLPTLEKSVKIQIQDLILISKFSLSLGEKKKQPNKPFYLKKRQDKWGRMEIQAGGRPISLPLTPSYHPAERETSPHQTSRLPFPPLSELRQATSVSGSPSPHQ